MNGEISPALAGSESLHIQTPMAVIVPVRQANDPFQSHNPAIVQFVSGQKIGIVIEVVQKPSKLPQSPVVAVEPGADMPPGERSRLQNQECGRQTRLTGVPGGREANDGGGAAGRCSAGLCPAEFGPAEFCPGVPCPAKR